MWYRNYRKLHKHYTKSLCGMVNMTLEDNSQIGKPWTISIRLVDQSHFIRLVDQSLNQYRINQLVYK